MFLGIFKIQTKIFPNLTMQLDKYILKNLAAETRLSDRLSSFLSL